MCCAELFARSFRKRGSEQHFTRFGVTCGRFEDPSQTIVIHFKAICGTDSTFRAQRIHFRAICGLRSDQYRMTCARSALHCWFSRQRCAARIRPALRGSRSVSAALLVFMAALYWLCLCWRCIAKPVSHCSDSGGCHVVELCVGGRSGKVRCLRERLKVIALICGRFEVEQKTNERLSGGCPKCLGAIGE